MGIEFAVAGAEALPCLYNVDVLREEADKRIEFDLPPRTHRAVKEKCWVVMATLSDTPIPFDCWIKVLRLKHKGAEDAIEGDACSTPLGSEEENMEVKWDQWIPAGTDAMYHMLRCVAQCPLREFRQLWKK